jgi:hypothetical protein
MAARKPIYVLWKYTTSNGGDVRYEGEFKGFDAVNKYMLEEMAEYAELLGDEWEYYTPSIDNLGDCIEYTRNYHDWYYEYEGKTKR